VAEGPAKVIMSYANWISPEGDILVCPGTNPAWTPVFWFGQAVVSDRGGRSVTRLLWGVSMAATLVNTLGYGTIRRAEDQSGSRKAALIILDKK